MTARKRQGLDSLLHAAIHHKDSAGPDNLVHDHKTPSHHIHDHHAEYTMVYSDAIEDKIDAIIGELNKKYPDTPNKRWHAIKLLEGDQGGSRKNTPSSFLLSSTEATKRTSSIRNTTSSTRSSMKS